MRRFLLTVLTLLASACTARIDERNVFAPPTRNDRAGTTAELESRWAQLPGATALPGVTRHGFVGEGDARIAWTAVARADSAGAPLIVRCGGNAADRYNAGVAYARNTLPFGDVLLFDYPGYGDSGGAPTAVAFEAASASVATLALDMARGRPIIFWGHSLGGFICGALAQRTPGAAGLIFEASARNAAEVAETWRPTLLAPFLRIDIAESLRGYDNAAAAVALRKPVLVLAAGRDDTLSVKLSRALAEAVQQGGGRATYVEFAAANHGTIPQAPGFKAAVDAYLDSVKRNAP
jgi:pimeloyl-ACP methyl ester carboxylesterase